jgi:hypothetical protein
VFECSIYFSSSINRIFSFFFCTRQFLFYEEIEFNASSIDVSCLDKMQRLNAG